MRWRSLTTAPATQAYRRPSKTSRTHTDVWPWPESETAAVAFRCRALGADEETAAEYLHLCRQREVRRLKAYVDRIVDADLEVYLDAARALSESYRATSRRADIIFLRSRVKRWPWRTRSDQPFAGVVGDV